MRADDMLTLLVDELRETSYELHNPIHLSSTLLHGQDTRYLDQENISESSLANQLEAIAFRRGFRV